MHNQEPAWVHDARTMYKGGVGSEFQETYVSRARTARDVLERKILPVNEGALDILLVGPGIGGYPIYGSWEPYLISGFLEGKRKPYRMTIVDKDPATIADIKSRRRVFVPNPTYIYHPECKIAWDSYLKEIGQNEVVSHEVVEGLSLATQQDGAIQARVLRGFLKKGFRYAVIPSSFLSKMESGDLVLVNADIATADLSVHNGFDFVSCCNVLYLLPEDGQKLAMNNISMNTRAGGIVLVNDLGYSGSPLLPRQGGWLTEERQGDLGLVTEEIVDESPNSQTLIFKKVS